MAEMTSESLLTKIQNGEAVERGDLRGLALRGAALAAAKLRRTALDGADLESANLRGAELVKATLRETYLVGADLSGANLEGADLEGANLASAVLRGANLCRANLEGATLSNADLTGARLSHAQCHGARLGGADLSDASCEHADLRECDLSGAKLCGADLSHVELTSADLMEADLTGAKVAALMAEAVAFRRARAQWVDVSTNGHSQRSSIEAWLSARGVPANTRSGTDTNAGTKRYFGRGDVLRNASLRFGSRARVEIQSIFEDCEIQLGDGTELIVGEYGVLASCRIQGGGDVVILGSFFEGVEPGIDAARSVTVRGSGTLVSTVAQGAEGTRFAFEPGSKLRLKIRKNKA